MSQLKNEIVLPCELPNDPADKVVAVLFCLPLFVTFIILTIDYVKENPLVLLFGVVPLCFFLASLSAQGALILSEDHLLQKGIVKSRDRAVFYRDIDNVEIVRRYSTAGRGGLSKQDVMVIHLKRDTRSTMEIRLGTIGEGPSGDFNRPLA